MPPAWPRFARPDVRVESVSATNVPIIIKTKRDPGEDVEI